MIWQGCQVVDVVLERELQQLQWNHNGCLIGGGNCDWCGGRPLVHSSIIQSDDMKPGCDCDILSVTGSSCHLPSPGWLRPGPGQDYRHPAQTWPGLSSVSSLETAAPPPSLLLQEAGRDRCCSRLAAWTNLDPNTGYNVGPTHFMIPVFCPDSWLHSISI